MLRELHALHYTFRSRQFGHPHAYQSLEAREAQHLAARNLIVEHAQAADIALEHGWIREGSPTTPTVPNQRRKRRRGLGSLFDPRGQPPDDPVVAEPILRRLSVREQQTVEAADIFNASDYRRTVGGIAKSLGQPRASIVPLSGVSGELIVTVAWDISWYQYRVTPDAAQPVRLAERGHELTDLDATYQRWNAKIEGDGRLVPDIERL